MKLFRIFLFLFCTIGCLSGCTKKVDFGAPLPIGGDFSFPDKTGNLVSLQNFREPVLLVFFGYTQCPDFCPNTLSKIKNTLTLLPDEKKESFRTIFISIDPTRDSGEVVQKYINFYLKNASGFVFPELTTAKLVKQYAAYVEKPKDSSTIDHSTYVYVLDKDRKTRVLLKSNDSAEHFAEIILSLSSDSI